MAAASSQADALSSTAAQLSVANAQVSTLQAQMSSALSTLQGTVSQLQSQTITSANNLSASIQAVSDNLMSAQQGVLVTGYRAAFSQTPATGWACAYSLGTTG